MTTEINFSELCGFSAKQWTATHTADAHKYTLFGGSRGPGKSYWLRWWLVRFLLRQAYAGRRGVRVMLACEDYPSLYERQVSKMEAEFPPWLGKFRRNDYVLAPCYGSGVIACRNLDDPSKYQSSEFAAMAIDEITKNPAKTFDILRGSLRWRGIEDVRLVGACNPEANWVREYWIEKSFPEGLVGHESDFAFVPALPQDNPHLDKSYWEMLETLSGALKAAWLHGDWYAAVEGLVYGTFSADNIVETEVDPSRPYDIAIDDGYIDPRATLFVQRQHNGDLLVFDELYETQRLEEQTIEAIQEKIATHKLNACRSAVVSHEAVALRQRLRNAKIPAFNWLEQKVQGSQSTRLAAITLTRSMICDGNGYRALKVHKRCKHLLDEIRAGYKYPEGKHGLETRPADGNDHACFVAGTLVTTTDGYKPIEAIRVGDYVLTRQGYKRVTAAGCTAIDAPIWQVDFSDGRTLRGTANHPVWVDGKGYSTIDALQGNDIIEVDQNFNSQEKMQCENQENQKQLSSTASSLIATLNLPVGQIATTIARTVGISRRALRRCTEKFGKRTMGQSLTDTMCITRTGIRSITSYPTWSAYHPSYIWSSTAEKKNLVNGGISSLHIWLKFNRYQRSGTAQKKDCDGTPSMASAPGRIAKPQRKFVYAAPKNTKLRLPHGQNTVRLPVATNTAMQLVSKNLVMRNVSVSIVAQNSMLSITATPKAVPVRVLQSIEIGMRQAVFNLTVEDANEFFANGVLVHNCNALEGYIWAAYGGVKQPRKKPTSKEY